MFDESSLPDGVLLGFVVDPDDGSTKTVALSGTPRELMQCVALLHLDMDQGHRDSLHAGTHEGPLLFTDERGSAVTVQPVSRASALLVMARDRARDEGINWPFGG